MCFCGLEWKKPYGYLHETFSDKISSCEIRNRNIKIELNENDDGTSFPMPPQRIFVI